MLSFRYSSLVMAASVVLAACQGPGEGGESALPPAAGQGVPAPALPPVEAAGMPPIPAASEGHTTGTTYPRAEAQISPKLGGIIEKLLVDEGARVKKGEPLMRLDGRSVILARQQAATGLAQAEVNLRATQLEYDRSKALFEQNALQRATWEQIQHRLDAAKLGVDTARLGVRQAQQAVNDLVTRAPMDGVIAMRLKSEGELVTMMPPTVVFVLQDHSSLELRFRLPEKALADIAPGQAVRATFEALGQSRDARVVRLSATVEPHTRTFEVVTEIDNAGGSLKPGMLAMVDIHPGAAPAGPDPAPQPGTPDDAPAPAGHAASPPGGTP